jgi:hypothetical protein
MVYIYSLELEHGKYYIGKTDHSNMCIIPHINSNGILWTQKYKPVKILEFIQNIDNYDEDKYVIKYMDLHGINNVRGGSFSSIILDKFTIKHLMQMCNVANNNCFICGNSNHYAKTCKINKDKIIYNNNKIIYNNDYCIRCGRDSHTITHCYASKDKNGKYFIIENNEYCIRCGRDSHTITHCYASKDKLF